MEQLTEKLAPVCCLPELCFGVQGIRNHIIDSCRERRRECKRQSYRPSKARPAGHLYNSDGAQLTPEQAARQVRQVVRYPPYTLLSKEYPLFNNPFQIDGDILGVADHVYHHRISYTVLRSNDFMVDSSLDLSNPPPLSVTTS